MEPNSRLGSQKSAEKQTSITSFYRPIEAKCRKRCLLTDASVSSSSKTPRIDLHDAATSKPLHSCKVRNADEASVDCRDSDCATETDDGLQDIISPSPKTSLVHRISVTAAPDSSTVFESKREAAEKCHAIGHSPSSECSKQLITAERTELPIVDGNGCDGEARAVTNGGGKDKGCSRKCVNHNTDVESVPLIQCKEADLQSLQSDKMKTETLTDSPCHSTRQCAGDCKETNSESPETDDMTPKTSDDGRCLASAEPTIQKDSNSDTTKNVAAEINDKTDVLASVDYVEKAKPTQSDSIKEETALAKITKRRLLKDTAELFCSRDDTTQVNGKPQITNLSEVKGATYDRDQADRPKTNGRNTRDFISRNILQKSDNDDFMDCLDDERSEPSGSLDKMEKRDTFRYVPRLRDREKRKNIDFYMNRIESVPRGAKIDVILQEWKGNYKLLETHHGYIQWLFPIPESGLNEYAQPLQAEEAIFLQRDEKARQRLISAYRMMLDFYGMELVYDEMGKVRRSKNWKERYSHLNSSLHNYLRITRILKCFVEVRLERLQLPFVKFLVHEVFVTRALSNCARSCRQYWVPTVKDKDTRHSLERCMRS